MFARLLVGVTLVLIVTSHARAAELDQWHALLDKVLKNYVKDAGVNYAGLKARPQELDAYLAQLAAMSEADFKRWTEKQQIAFLINAYNAYTLRLILDHYPLKSIKDIGRLGSGPWEQPIVHLLGKALTLNTVEHKMLRKDYREPRIHFALVCAAKHTWRLDWMSNWTNRLGSSLPTQKRIAWM